MLIVLGVLFLVLIIGYLFFKFGLNLILAAGGVLRAILIIATIIGLIVLFACFA